MKPIYLFDVASQYNQWLSARQSVLAQNIANASTPGFKTMDVKPFAEAISEARVEMARTDKAHFYLDSEAGAETEIDAVAGQHSNYSGNNVSLEREFEKSGEVNRSFALNIGLLKAFNRMLLASAKG